MKADEPAFPLEVIGTVYGGLTQRDYIAIKAMQGIISGLWSDANNNGASNENIAKDSYRLADAMIAQSQKEIK